MALALDELKPRQAGQGDTNTVPCVTSLRQGGEGGGGMQSTRKTNWHERDVEKMELSQQSPHPEYQLP